MYKRLSILLVISVLCAFLFTACGQKEPVQSVDSEVSTTVSEPDETPMPAPEESTESAPEPVPEIDDGFVVPEEGVRPIAVMIDNEGTRVLPQGGLNKAQIVYEAIVEGGLTRLMAVFWGTDPELIGPVRSSRHYFLDFSMEYDAMYAHVGWSTYAQNDIKELKINNINGLYLGTDVFWDLTNDKKNWQDTYTSMEKLQAYVAKKYKTTTDTKYPFEYNRTDVVPASGQSAAAVTFKYPSMTSRYEYDSETGLYKRYRNDKPHMERVSGEQLTAKNIIVRYTNSYTIKGDKYGRQEMETTGSGDGYYITGGKAIKIKWSKASRSAQTKYTDESGNALKLNRGQTWIQVMPLSSKVIIE